MGCSKCGNATINCGERTEGACVFIDITLPAYSAYADEDCTDPVASDLFEELYGEVDDLREFTDMEAYDNLCLPEAGSTLLSIIQEQTNEICSLKDRIEYLEEPCNILDMDISACGIDVSCLETDICNNPVTVTTIGALFSTLLEEICALKQ